MTNEVGVLPTIGLTDFIAIHSHSHNNFPQELGT